MEPQGSVLGPLLSIVCINDLNKMYIFNSATRHFADDTNLLHIIDQFQFRNRKPNKKIEYRSEIIKSVAHSLGDIIEYNKNWIDLLQK